MKRFSFCILFVAVSFFWGTSASAQNRSGNSNQNNQKISRDLQESLKSGAATQRVIISVKSEYRASVRRALESHGDLIQSEHSSISALSGVVHSSDIAELARQPWVDSIAADAAIFAIDDNGSNANTQASNGNGGNGNGGNVGASSSGSGSTPNLYLRQTLGLPAAAGPDTPKGSGIVVAVIDSGLVTSQDLSATRLLGFYDLTVCKTAAIGCSAPPIDPLGHGTHVAGLIGSSGELSGGLYQGIAPGVTFLGIRVLNENGQGYASDLIRAVELVIANPQWHVRVINLSLGATINLPAILDPIVRVVEQASAAGITVVVAAGNNPKGSGNTYAGITTPGNSPSALTTGATDTQRTISRGDDVVADYSARGPTWLDGFAKPDFVSPGSNLISDMDAGSALYKLVSPASRQVVNGHTFVSLSGTSMGSGVASGVVALVLDAQRKAMPGSPWLTPNAVKAILEYTAIPVTKNNPDVLTQGAGQINAAGAITLASNIDTSATFGDWWLTGGVTPSTTIGSRTYAWSESILWGTRVLGGNLVYHNLLLWSKHIIWGTNILWGTADTAGDSILWGTLRTIEVSRHAKLAFALRIVGGKPTLYVSGRKTTANSILWGTSTGPLVKASNIIWGTGAIWGRHLTAGRVLGVQLDGDSILWGTTSEGDSILWGTARETADNILWGTWDGDSILWGTWEGDSILWGTSCHGVNTLAGATLISSDGQSIIWGTWDGANIIWGTGENIIWGTGENIIWGTGANIIWGTGENIVWGTGENIVWGTFRSGGAF